MIKEFQLLNREGFDAFWKAVQKGRFEARAWKSYLAATLILAVSLFGLYWLKTWWPLEELVIAGYFAYVIWVRNKTLSSEEKRFLTCPNCDREFISSDIEAIVTTSRCRKCGADILA